MSLTFSAYAEENQGNSDLPSLELLEFIASFTSNDQQWVDPTILEEMMMSEANMHDDDVKEKTQ